VNANAKFGHGPTVLGDGVVVYKYMWGFGRNIVGQFAGVVKSFNWGFVEGIEQMGVQNPDRVCIY
jgi:hypothetical protein